MPNARTKQIWIHYAVAAAVVLAFSTGVLLMVRTTQQAAVAKAQEQALPLVDGSVGSVTPEPRVVVTQIPAFDEEPTSPVPEPEVAPLPRQPAIQPRPVYGSPPFPAPQLDAILVRLPMIAMMKDLAQDNVRKQLATELSRSSQARIDLFSSDPFQAAELLVTTGRALGVNVMLDAAAQERLRRRIPTSWILYTEALTPDEAAQWMARLAAADASVFQSLHLPGLAAQDQKDLKDLLGIDLAKPGKRVTTLDQITASLEKDKAAVLASYLPTTARSNAAQSKTVKLWLERRSPKAGTISLMIVVR